jgi:hypothetical protein
VEYYLYGTNTHRRMSVFFSSNLLSDYQSDFAWNRLTPSAKITHLEIQITAMFSNCRRKNTTTSNRFLCYSAAMHLLLLSLSGSQALTAVDSTLTFRPCPPPRFDDFSDKLLGEWRWRAQQENENGTASAMSTANVEEVMRSCGGAVQGIREVPGICIGNKNDDSDEGIYLNRSNDGFVFFDQDASYSCGSVVFPVEAAATTTTNTNIWISSLSMGKSRLCIVSKSVHGTKGEEHAAASSDCCYQLFRKYNWNDDDQAALSTIHLVEQPTASIVWNKIAQCRTSSLNQPWMLQRAKWESFSFDNNVMDIVQMDQVGSGPLTAWKLTQSSSDLTIYPQELRMSDASTAFSIGAICSRTGYVKSMLRQYSTQDKSLQSVAWLEGRLSVEDDEEELQ